jgi:hypothetical protein
MKAAAPAVPQRDITVLQDYMLTLTQALPPVASPHEERSTDAAGSNSSNSSAEQQQQVCALHQLHSDTRFCAGTADEC